VFAVNGWSVAGSARGWVARPGRLAVSVWSPAPLDRLPASSPPRPDYCTANPPTGRGDCCKRQQLPMAARDASHLAKDSV
jgi:hypothetical protein